MAQRNILLIVLLTVAAMARPQSALNSREFQKWWRVESESPDYRVSFRGDTCELVAPKGLTLWRREKLKADCAVEYDVQVVVSDSTDRLSDMNCFWLASDPEAGDIWKRLGWRNGIFTRCYTLQMYYLGYGGNYNTTTRFRRYTGDAAGVDDEARRPAILTEYTDESHLLKPNHWYHVKLQTAGGRTRMWVDGQPIVSYLDPEPLREGWFGFRTTLSRTRITNFRSYAVNAPAAQPGVPLSWVGSVPQAAVPVTFGIPFAEGELTDVFSTDEIDTWVNARWPDGSVKWAGVAMMADPAADLAISLPGKPKTRPHTMDIRQTDQQLIVSTGRLQVYLPRRQGRHLMDSLLIDGTRVGSAAWLTATCATDTLTSRVSAVTLERHGSASAVVRIEGLHQSAEGRRWLPFCLRLYFWKGSERIKLVHSFVYDGEAQHDKLTSLGIRFAVPMRQEVYNRHIAFATDDGGIWAEPVQPLDSRRPLSALQAQQQGRRVARYADLPERDRQTIDELAAWDRFRLSQLTDNSFSVRKRATGGSPWIGTFTGRRSPGHVFVGDTGGGLSVSVKDFWQSYPSTIQVDRARSSEALLTMYLWSPEAEPMDLCHYDTVPHGLLASYEDVQEGLSTPYGIARTTTLWLVSHAGLPSRDALSAEAGELADEPRLLPTPEYLHRKRAFGLWSLPPAEPSADEAAVEQRLAQYLDFYRDAIEQHKWYGFWNYGDLMHAYTPERHSWRYDVGGYAWDNTELATPMWLWYSFLRTGRADVWRMAEAMTRHNAEVDTYHLGPLAPLGSRHNVSHWGCGAKEARISQSAFLRFYYYLTCDERTGDLMQAQTDADTLLYHLDPMRLAEPREQFPCTAPARLRLGPDWLAYAGNWLTEWERTGNRRYRDKIVTGMESIAAMPNGFFTGNKALGYYPDTGRITYEGPADRLSTNHLATIMGGFEVMNELLPLAGPAFRKAWLDLAINYKQRARDISGNRFPVRRLMAYGAWQTRDPRLTAEAWADLWGRIEHAAAPRFSITRLDGPAVAAPIDEWQGLSTNDAALWSLDAIYMQEVLLTPTNTNRK